MSEPRLNKTNSSRNKRSNCFSDLSQKLTSLDVFEENFSMKIDKGNSGLNTSFGSMLTILVYGLIVLYTYLKIDVWITKKDVDIM